MNAFRALALAALMLGLPGTWAIALAQEESSQGLVLVQRTVNTKYEPGSPDFSALLKSTLTQPYVVKKNDNLQKILSERFAMGPTATPELYEPMAERIKSLNNLSNRDAIREGFTLALPDIPPVQWKKRSPDNPNYGVPRVQGGPEYAAVLSGQRSGLYQENEWRQIFDKGRKAEPLVNQWRWLTVEQARAEAQAMGANDAGLNSYWAQPLTLKFAQPSPAIPPGPTATVASDLQYLSALIKRRPPQQDVVVYVLDDAWPSDAGFESSRAFLVGALAAIRKAYFIPDGGLPPALNNGTAGTDFPAVMPPGPLHSARIASSLADFNKLTPRVKVVYLPLFTQQKWAKELWQELTYTALVATALHSKLGIAEPGPGILSRARSDAIQLVGQIPSKVVNSLGPAQQTPITVLQKFAQLYAVTTGVPYFLSMSWTVEKREIDFGPDPDSLGVSLAATGNDGKEVIGDAVYLAYRAKAVPGDVLAVMNTDGSGKELCGSSKLPLSGPHPFYGLAYDGTFDSGLQCGSSFSTPRVAWLLALRQSYNAPVSKPSWPDWYASFRTSILSLQSATQTTSRRYWLPVNKLFDGL